MKKSSSYFELISWDIAVFVICTLVFLLTAGGLLPNLPTNSTLLISLGGMSLGLGEWQNRTHHFTILEKLLEKSNKLTRNYHSVIFITAGIYLIYKGTMLIL